MNDDKTTPYTTRAAIMNLLSDNEVTQVAISETSLCLTDGDAYIDLEKLSEGVQNAILKIPRTSNILAEKSVKPATWRAILAKLEESGVKLPPAKVDERLHVN